MMIQRRITIFNVSIKYFKWKKNKIFKKIIKTKTKLKNDKIKLQNNLNIIEYINNFFIINPHVK